MKQKHAWLLVLSTTLSIALVIGLALVQKTYFGGIQPASSVATSRSGTGQVESAPETEAPDSQLSPDNPAVQTTVLNYQSRYGALPESLDGAVMGQTLLVDESGHLRISDDIRRVFDFFLSTIEEEPLDTILARIDEYLQHYLEEPALGEAKQILSQYIGLKQALYDFETERSASLRQVIESGELQDNKGLYLSLLEEQLQARDALRAEYLSPEVHETFYAEEQAYDQYTLARMKVMSDDTIAEEQKQQALAQIDAAAPEQLVQSRERSQVTDILKERTARLRQQGADEHAVRQLRTEMLGSEAANRFEALDREREVWQQRVESYLLKRKAILNSEGLSLQEREHQINALRSSLFDSREQIRVSTLERLASS